MISSPRAIVRTLALATAAVASVAAVPAQASDSHLALTVDNRALSHSASAALVRNDVAYVALDEMIRTFGGLETAHGRATLATLNGRSATFRTNEAAANVDGTRRAMPAQAFRAGGHLYVPLRFFVTYLVPHATVRIDRADATANVRVPIPTVS